MRCKIIILAAAAHLIGVRLPAEAAATTTALQVAATEMVEIPFAPPLGRTLRYRMLRERTGSGPPRRDEANFDVTFRRSNREYVMSVRLALPRGLPPPDRLSAIAQVFNAPAEFRLSESGEMLELLNLERHWATADRALREIERARPIDVRARAAAAAMVDRMRAMPAEAQLELYARYVAPIVAAAGGAYPVGEAISAQGPAQSLVGPLQQRSTARVTGLDRRLVRISQHSSVSNEQLEAQMRALFSEVGPPGQDLSRLRIISNDLVESYEVSRETGLTERFRSEKIVVTETNGERDRGGEVLTLQLAQ